MITQRVGILCPRCGRTLQVRAENLGRKGLCKYCGNTFRARVDSVVSHAPRSGRGSHDRVAAEDDARLGSRVRTLEFEFQELLTHLTLQTSQHMAALEELHETKSRLRELERRDRQRLPGGSAGALLAWEVQVVDEPPLDAGGGASAAESSSATEQPSVHLFESPSSEAQVAPGTGVPALPVPADGGGAAERERDALRAALESLRAELAEQGASRELVEQRAAALASELETARAEWEEERARFAAFANEHQCLRDELTALQAAHEHALEETRNAQIVERPGRDEPERDLAAEREALSRELSELRERLEADRREHAAAAGRWEAERETLQHERVQLREALDAQERSQRDDAERHEHDRQRWDSERGTLLADAERTLSEQCEQFDIERRSLQQQLDAGRGTEAEYQALRQEAESLHQRLEAVRQERDEALRRAEAAEYAVEEADQVHTRAEAERERLERELQAERELRERERAEALAAHEAASRGVEAQAETLRGEIERLTREQQSRGDEHAGVLSALQREFEREMRAFEDELAGVRGEAARLRADLEAAVRERVHAQQEADALARECDNLKERLAQAESARLREAAARTSERRRADEAQGDSHAEHLRAAEAQLDSLRAEVEHREQQRAALEQERNALQEQLGRIEAARVQAEAQVRGVVEELRATTMTAMQERDDALRELDQLRQERDRLAAEGSGADTSSQETVRRLAGVLAQLSQYQAASSQRKVELVDQVRMLKSALATHAPEAAGSRLRPRSDSFNDPTEFRSALSLWLGQAQKLRERAEHQLGQLAGEIQAAGDDLAHLNRDAALSELDDEEEDVVFGLIDSECPEEA